METKTHEHTHKREESWTGVIISAVILSAGLIAEFITNTILVPHLLYLAVMIYAGYSIANQD